MSAAAGSSLRRESAASTASAEPKPLAGARVMIVVNVDWFFLSHRLPVARAARDAGAEVTVVTADTGRGEQIRAEGFHYVPMPLSRQGTHPAREAAAVLWLTRLYRRMRPHLVHHVAPKPVIYGSLAARAVGGIAVVNAISGLGYAFSAGARARMLRPLVKGLYGLALRAPGSRAIFQNPDHRRAFEEAGLVKPGASVLIRGSGVDCAVFRALPEPPGPPVVLFASRMLWDKGVQEFVDLARALRAAGAHARFVLSGGPDPGNPNSVPREQLQGWAGEGVVEWHGFQRGMEDVFAGASVVVLPTRYPEGVPKTLIEAAACGRPIVTTDVPGCREIVRDGANGFLVPPGDAGALQAAVRRLLDDPGLRARQGAAGRALAQAEFAEERVVAQTLALYADLLAGAKS